MKRKTKIVIVSAETIALAVALTALGLSFASAGSSGGNSNESLTSTIETLNPTSTDVGEENQPPNPALISTSNDQDIYVIPEMKQPTTIRKPKKYDDVVPDPDPKLLSDYIERQRSIEEMQIPPLMPPRDPGWRIPQPRSANPITSTKAPNGSPFPSTIRNHQYTNANYTELIIPNVTSIGDGAFWSSELTTIYAPNAQTIGACAFTSVVNDESTIITLPVKFNSYAEKCRILNDDNASKHDKIQFRWVNDQGDEIATNEFKGQFNNQEDEDQFLKTTATCYQVLNCQNLTGISLPYTTNIVYRAFNTAQMTAINVPEATTIGDEAFWNTVNDRNTIVTMKSKFNTVSEKNRIFGTNTGPNTGSGWDHIYFNWV